MEVIYVMHTKGVKAVRRTKVSLGYLTSCTATFGYNKYLKK